jgi:GNAT superfamily N-acetyltransferase
MLAIINVAAEAYRGVIPADRWHVPYMPWDELNSEIAAGVMFWGCVADGVLVGVMGIQSARDVDLIRHAYVLPGSQRHGVGGAVMSPSSAAIVRPSEQPTIIARADSVYMHCRSRGDRP